MTMSSESRSALTPPLRGVQGRRLTPPSRERQPRAVGSVARAGRIARAALRRGQRRTRAAAFVRSCSQAAPLRLSGCKVCRTVCLPTHRAAASSRRARASVSRRLLPQAAQRPAVHPGAGGERRRGAAAGSGRVSLSPRIATATADVISAAALAIAIAPTTSEARAWT